MVPAPEILSGRTCSGAPVPVSRSAFVFFLLSALFGFSEKKNTVGKLTLFPTQQTPHPLFAKKKKKNQQRQEDEVVEEVVGGGAARHPSYGAQHHDRDVGASQDGPRRGEEALPRRR